MQPYAVVDVVLAMRMPWSTIEARLTPLFERRMREVQSSTVPGLFGMAPKLAGVEKLLATTITVAAQMKMLKPVDSSA